MPQSRKRPGHHEFQKPSAIPAKQRTHATTICALLFAVFAGIIAFFAGASYWVIAVSVIAGAAIGYAVGKAMERDASNKA
ncbi:MAG: hypothetical protein JWP88_1287 [Flaviaesturariibacter sp.]|nr:hypothetical protein [Flaviaesturariibacter sp.]